MSVSDSISDLARKPSRSHSKTSYGDGSIWMVKKPSGGVVWKVEVQVGLGPDGKPRKTRRMARSRAEAIELRRSLNAEKLRGELEKRVSTKFTEFSIHWVREVKAQSLRATTVADYEYRLRQYLLPHFTTLELREVTPTQIHRWMNDLRSKGLSVNTVNGARRVLFGVMNYALKLGLISSNPVRATEAQSQEHGSISQVKPHWSKEEAMLALSRVEGEVNVDLFLHLAVFLGLRHGELLGLCWSDVDLERGELRVTQTLRDFREIQPDGSATVGTILNAPKTKSSRRTLQIPVAVLESFKRHQMMQSMRRVQAGNSWVETDFVFTSSIGTSLNQSNSRKAFSRFIRENKLRYIRIHDIRHTTAVLALEAGAPLEWISQALGHSGTEITKKVYAPYVQALNDRFVEVVSQLLTDKKRDSSDDFNFSS